MPDLQPTFFSLLPSGVVGKHGTPVNQRLTFRNSRFSRTVKICELFLILPVHGYYPPELDTQNRAEEGESLRTAGESQEITNGPCSEQTSFQDLTPGGVYESRAFRG